MYIQKQVGTRIKESRRAMNISRETVARELGFSEDTVKKAEQGRNISLNFVTLFSERYSIKLDYLFWGNESAEAESDADKFIMDFCRIPKERRDIARKVIHDVWMDFIG